MRRREAILVFREICKCIPDMFISSVSLTPIDRLKGEFELRIYASIDAKGFNNVQSVAQKHGMSVMQEQGSLLIYPTAKEIEITA